MRALPFTRESNRKGFQCEKRAKYRQAGDVQRQAKRQNKSNGANLGLKENVKWLSRRLAGHFEEQKTASAYLKELENIGILRGQKVGGENLYLNVKLYELLSR